MDRENVRRNPGKIWATGKKWIKHQWLSGPKNQSNPLSLAVRIVSCPNPLPTAHYDCRVKASTRWCWAHNHDGVITHLEPDILECDIKWALGSNTRNKASKSDGIPAELFQILKDDPVKVLHSICQQIWKSAAATGLEKVSFHSNPKEEQCQRMLKLPHNCTHPTC